MEQTRHVGDAECLRSIAGRLDKTDRDLVNLKQEVYALEAAITAYESQIAAIARFIYENGLLDGLSTRKAAELLRMVRASNKDKKHAV